MGGLRDLILNTEKSIENRFNYYSDKIAKKMAGPEPDLDPAHILEQLNKNELLQSENFKSGKTSISFDTSGVNPPADKRDPALIIIQRALVALGLLKVDRTKKYWWTRKDAFPYKIDDGRITWGEYGQKTTKAVAELQDLSGINLDKGKRGAWFGRDTLPVLKVALDAMVKKQDWRKVVKDYNYKQHNIKQ